MARGQDHAASSPSRADEAGDEPIGGAEVADHKARLDADVDEILDEIDDVLEENAEEFVSSFVQKGGE